VIRGGTYNSVLKVATATHRACYLPSGEPGGYYKTGFRAVREVNGEFAVAMDKQTVG